MSTTTASKAASKVHSLAEIWQILDYGEASLPRYKTFSSDIRAFRKKYRTATGLEGPELCDWSSAEHKAALTEMATTYLDKEGKGQLFWPDDKTSINYNKLQYSYDSLPIKQHVKELFFRLNQQLQRSQKSYEKVKQHTSGAKPSGLGNHDPLNPKPSRQPEITQGASMETAYEVPQSPQSLDGSNGSVSVSPNWKRPRNEDLEPQFARRTKKPKPTRSNSKRNKEFDDFAKWTSPRTKTPRRSDDFIVGKELDEALDIATRERSKSPIPVIAPTASTSVAHAEQREVVSDIVDDTSKNTDGHQPVSPLTASSLSRHDRIMQWSHRPTAPLAPMTPSIAEGTPESNHQLSEHRTPTRIDPSPSKPDSVVAPDNATPTPHRQGVEFVYTIVTRNPGLKYRVWKPKGRFQDKTMASLIAELALPGPAVKSLVFRLEASGFKLECEIALEEEGCLDVMRRKITNYIREWRTTNLGRKLLIDMEIEPIKEVAVSIPEELDDIVEAVDW